VRPTHLFQKRIARKKLKIKGARVELFFKHYNLYKNPRLKIKLSLALFSNALADL